MRSEWTYDLDAVEKAASVIEHELMTALDRFDIRFPHDGRRPRNAPMKS